jgi:hypothetical protein
MALLVDSVDRNYMEHLIGLAQKQTGTARAVAVSFGLNDVSEKLAWALDFQRVALAKLATGTNEDGTFGPSHITDTGRELREPPQG